MADNLLKSKEIDTTPQGNQTTTIIQKIIEICKDGNTATRTGAELGHIKSHQNSVFTYKGDPATYVSEAEGVFTFAVTDISDGLRCFTISHSSANAITVSERTVS